MVDYTERRKTKRKKRKWPRSKFIRICPQEMLSQRVKGQEKTFFVCFYADQHSPGLDDTQKEERLRENEEGLNQNS